MNEKHITIAIAAVALLGIFLWTRKLNRESIRA